MLEDYVDYEAVKQKDEDILMKENGKKTRQLFQIFTTFMKRITLLLRI